MPVVMRWVCVTVCLKLVSQTPVDQQSVTEFVSASDLIWSHFVAPLKPYSYLQQTNHTSIFFSEEECFTFDN